MCQRDARRARLHLTGSCAPNVVCVRNLPIEATIAALLHDGLVRVVSPSAAHQAASVRARRGAVAGAALRP